MKSMFFITLLTFALQGCGNEQTKDVQYYLDHGDERSKKLTECRNNPGEKQMTPNCQNASSAEVKAMFGKKK